MLQIATFFSQYLLEGFKKIIVLVAIYDNCMYEKCCLLLLVWVNWKRKISIIVLEREDKELEAVTQLMPSSSHGQGQLPSSWNAKTEIVPSSFLF